jgi:hypothetical protein
MTMVHCNINQQHDGETDIGDNWCALGSQITFRGAKWPENAIGVSEPFGVSTSPCAKIVPRF